MVVPTCALISLSFKAAEVVMNNGSHLDAVEVGCSECETEQCDGTVGYGGRCVSFCTACELSYNGKNITLTAQMRQVKQL